MAANAVSSGAISALQCTICGDDASAFNFGILSCEPCKAFFRRAVRSSKVPVCLFSGDCLVTLLTRRFCAACRLRKCQTAGMNECLVLSEEQRRVRQERIDSNRLRKVAPYVARSPRTHAPQGALCEILPVSSVNDSPAVFRALPVLMADEEAMPSEKHVTSQFGRSVDSSFNAASDQEELSVGSLNCRAGSSTSENFPAAVDSVNTPYACLSACVVPVQDGLPNLPTVITVDVPGSFLASQQPLCSPTSSSSAGFNETTTLLALQHSHRPCLPEQRQPPQPLLPRATTSSQRCLAPETCDALETLTRLYKAKLAASRRSPLPMTVGVGSVMVVTGKPESRDADRVNRQQQFAFRLSDLVSGCVLFARELPIIAQLPVEVRMALVKACAPTFILIRAAELYDETRAAWVDEFGDVVPATIVDDLLAESRRESVIEFPVATACYRHRCWGFLSAVKRQIRGRSPSGSPDQTVIALLQAIALLSAELVPVDVVVSGNVLETIANAQQHYICLLRQHLEATTSFEEAAEWWTTLLNDVVEVCKRTAGCVSDLLLSCDAVRGDELLSEILQYARKSYSRVPSPSAVAK